MDIKIPIPHKELLLQLDRDILLVGGAIRDFLLGRELFDYDFLSKNAYEVAELFSKEIGGKRYFLKVTDKRKTISVVKDGIMFDFSLLDSSLEDNLQSRDFTMNAMAYRIKDGMLFDPFGGLEDIERKIIRVINEKSLEVDPGRILRAFRFLVLLGFTMDDKTEEEIKSKKELLRNLQPERIRFELFRIFTLRKGISSALRKMMDMSVLGVLIPELTPSVGCTQNVFHRYDVWEHTLKSIDYAEDLEDEKSNIVLTDSDRFILKFSLLLHDAGKPYTKSGFSPQEVHFYGHEGEGAKIAEKVAERFHLSNREKNFMVKLIINHMRPMEMAKKLKKGSLSRKEVERFLRKNEDVLYLLYLMVISDIRAKEVDVEKDERRAEEFFSYLFDYYHNTYLPKKKKPLVRGKDLIEWGFKPSPLFGEILRFVDEMELKGVISTKEEAKRLILSKWKPR